MKKCCLIFLILIFSMLKVDAWSYTQFSLWNSGNDFEFYLKTGFSFGSSSACPKVYAYDIKKSNDTLYVIPYYDERGGWFFVGCVSYDTIRYTNLYSGINYINVSKNAVQDGSGSTIDTVLNTSDTTFNLHPTMFEEHSFSNYFFSVCPNPAEHHITIQNIKLLNCTEFQCYNSIGQKVLGGSELIKNEGVIDISSLISGQYYLILFDNNRNRLESIKFQKYR